MFLGIILRYLRLQVSLLYKTGSNHFCSGGGGRGVTVNSKEENSYGFCPNYVQEFGLWTREDRGPEDLKKMKKIHEEDTSWTDFAKQNWESNIVSVPLHFTLLADFIFLPKFVGDTTCVEF